MIKTHIQLAVIEPGNIAGTIVVSLVLRSSIEIVLPYKGRPDYCQVHLTNKQILVVADGFTSLFNELCKE
jgi:hypothetical protein